MKGIKTNVTMWVIIICYSIMIGSGLLFGTLYIANPDLLGYHLNAIGVSGMQDIPDTYRLMFQTFKRAAGLGMLGNALAMIILLVCQIRLKTRWARWALFAVSAPYWFALFANVFYLETNTGAGAPMIPNLVVALLSLVGLAAGKASTKKTEVLYG